MPVIPFSPVGLATGFALRNRFKFSRQHVLNPVTLRTEIRNTDGTPETLTFTPPVDPLISVEQQNTIACRQPATPKIKGSVKEFFATNDFNINISGLLMSDDKDCVDGYCQKLRRIAQSGLAVELICPYINDTFDIMKIVIESLKFPFTEGEENQQFTLQCKSDPEEYNLIVKE